MRAKPEKVGNLVNLEVVRQRKDVERVYQELLRRRSVLKEILDTRNLYDGYPEKERLEAVEFLRELMGRLEAPFAKVSFPQVLQLIDCTDDDLALRLAELSVRVGGFDDSDVQESRRMFARTIRRFRL
jgi:hypothetical protein